MRNHYTSSLIVWLTLSIGLGTPAFLNVGYGFYNTETWVLIVSCALLAVIAAWLVPINTRRCAIAASFILVVYLDLYLPMLLRSWLVFSIVLLVAIALAVFFSKQMVFISTIAIGGGMIGAYLQTPPPTTVHLSRELSTNNLPSVIHILLDEHASDWGIPRSLIPSADLDKMWEGYVKAGFLVFDKSYGLHKFTHDSVAHLFNSGMKGDLTTSLSRVGGDYRLNSASSLETIAKHRTLNINGIGFIDLAPALHQIENVSFYATSNPMIGSDWPRLLGASLKDRMILAAGVSWAWLYSRQDSPRVRWLTDHNGFLYRLYGARWRAVAPTALLVANEFAERLQKAKRGEYHFAHILLPHRPYVLDQDCRLQYRRMSGLLPGNEQMAARAEHYRLYFKQLQCAQKQVMAILAAIKSNPLLSDATIILHGDHGSRINLPKLADWLAAGGSRNEYERDWRAAFVAIRIPGLGPRRYQRPTELTDIYGHLVSNNFQQLDLDALHHEDSSLTPGAGNSGSWEAE